MHYELYIDVFFMVNFMMDTILLLITRKMIGSHVTYKRIYLGAVAGAALTCLIVAVPIPYEAVKLILFHGFVNIVMIQTGLGAGSVRDLLKTWICLYISSFLVGGVFQFFYQYIRIGSLFFLLAVISYYAVNGVLALLEYMLVQKDYRCQVALYKNERTVQVQALIDTGNSLRDAVTDQPVHIIDQDTAESLFSVDTLQMVRFIPYHSIGNKEGIMPLVLLDGMCILKKEKQWIDKPLVAICEGSLTDDQYKMILNPDSLR